jgi:hypothetical protein
MNPDALIPQLSNLTPDLTETGASGQQGPANQPPGLIADKGQPARLSLIPEDHRLLQCSATRHLLGPAWARLVLSSLLHCKSGNKQRLSIADQLEGTHRPGTWHVSQSMELA